jgi:hypothetical protein
MGSRMGFDRARRGRRRGGDGELAEVGERRAPGQQSLLSVVPSQAGSTLARATTPRRDPWFVAIPMLIAVSLVISRLIHTMPGRAARYQRWTVPTQLLFTHGTMPSHQVLRHCPDGVMQTEPLSSHGCSCLPPRMARFRMASQPTPTLCTTMM